MFVTMVIWRKSSIEVLTNIKAFFAPMIQSYCQSQKSSLGNHDVPFRGIG